MWERTVATVLQRDGQWFAVMTDSDGMPDGVACVSRDLRRVLDFVEKHADTSMLLMAPLADADKYSVSVLVDEG